MDDQLFDFNAGFKLGIDAIDQAPIKRVEMLNSVHALLRAEARNAPGGYQPLPGEQPLECLSEEVQADKNTKEPRRHEH